MPEALKILFSPPMNIRTHIQALLICTMPCPHRGKASWIHGPPFHEPSSFMGMKAGKRCGQTNPSASLRTKRRHPVFSPSGSSTGLPPQSTAVPSRPMRSACVSCPSEHSSRPSIPNRGPNSTSNWPWRKKTSLKTWWSENCSAMNLKAWAASLGTLSLTRKSTAPS